MDTPKAFAIRKGRNRVPARRTPADPSHPYASNTQQVRRTESPRHPSHGPSKGSVPVEEVPGDRDSADITVPETATDAACPTADAREVDAVDEAEAHENRDKNLIETGWIDDSYSSSAHGEDSFENVEAQDEIFAAHAARVWPPFYGQFASSGQHLYPPILEVGVGDEADAEAEADIAAYEAATARGMDPRHAFPQGLSYEEWSAMAMRSHH